MTTHLARRDPFEPGDSLDGWLTVCGRPLWECTFVVAAVERVTCSRCRVTPTVSLPPAPALSDETPVDSSQKNSEAPEIDYSGCPAIGVFGMHCEHFGPDEDGCCWCGERPAAAVTGSGSCS